MSNETASTVRQNILPVQALFSLDNQFQTFIGQGQPFTVPISPDQSGLHITNSTIDSTTIGATTPSTGNFTNIFTVTGQITTAPSTGNDIANKAYVDSVAQGLSPKAACNYSTTGNITLSGLGTQTGGDWASPLTAGDRVLVKNQSAPAENGIYIASASGWSRSGDMNTWDEVVGAYTVVISGTLNADSGWVCTAPRTGTIGVTAMPWELFTGSGSYTAGTGLTLVGTQFNIANTGVGAGTYGSASAVPVFNVNAQGQLTSVSNTSIAIGASQITSGTISSSLISGSYTGITGVGTITAGTWNANAIQPAYGGTGLTSFNVGDLLVATGTTTLSTLADVATGNALISGGVNTSPSWGKIGLTTHVSGVLPIANGGTNSTATPTAGGVAYGTGTAYAVTAAGTAGQVLTSTGAGAPTWTTGATSVGTLGYFGSFWDTTTQTATAANTAYSVTLNSADTANNGVSVTSGSRVTFAKTGVYSVTFSIQFTNSDSQIHDANVWLRKNDSGSSGDIPDTDSKFSVPNKHGGTDGNLIGTVNFVLSLTAGDYIELIWSATNTAIQLSAFAAGTTPVSPSIPSVIVTAVALPQIGLGYGGLTSSSTVTPGTGTKTFTTNLSAADVAFTVGTQIVVASTVSPSDFVQGTITSFTGTTLVMNSTVFSGSTPRSSWTISVAGSSGVTSFSGGTTGLTPASATQGAVTLAGTLVAANGGTGQSSYTTGDILYASGSSALSKLAIGSNTNILTSSGTAPQWSASSTVSVGTATNLAGGAAGQVPYQSGAGATAFTATGTSGQVLTSNGTSAPTWTTPTAYATVTDDTTTNATRYPLFANVTTGNLTTEYVSSTNLQFNPSTGTLTSTIFSGSGASLTNLPAGQLSGTIPSSVLGNSTVYIGTTAIALNRGSGSQTLTGTSIDGSAGSATTAGTATNANNVAITDDTTTNATVYPVWVTTTSGNLPVKTASTKLKFNPSTGALTANQLIIAP